MQPTDNNWKLILEWWLELQERNIERRALLTTEGLGLGTGSGRNEGLTTEGLGLGTCSGAGGAGEERVLGVGEGEEARDNALTRLLSYPFPLTVLQSLPPLPSPIISPLLSLSGIYMYIYI